MIRFTAHAELMLAEREIERAWVDRVLASPEWREKDPNDPALTRAFGRISEAGGKILRIVYSGSGTESRIVTVFFDARAKKPEGSRT